MPSGAHVGSAMVNGFPESPAFPMAVTGRQKLKWYFAFIQPMNESANPVQTIANSRAVSEVSRPRAAASARNARAYCLVVCSVQNRPISVCAGVLTVLLIAPRVLVSLKFWAHSSLPRAGGGSSGRNCEALLIVKGTI